MKYQLAWMQGLKEPSVAELLCAQNWLTGGVGFESRSRSTTLPFGFRGFLRNSRKYRLRCLGKTLTEGIPPIDPGPTSGQLDIKPTSTTTGFELVRFENSLKVKQTSILSVTLVQE